jgi:hypothetical protein
MTVAGVRRWPWAPLLVVVLSLLSHLGAAVPGHSYYFRDFSVTFFPQRAFQAAELAAGRWPSWNPYLHEGTFVLPALYPLDLLHVLWPGPAAVSWLLTMQFPLAGLAAYALAREMGASRPGAVASGAAYALGGLAVSCLNLYLFLQALALAPALVLGLRRAAVRGGRDIVWAALLLALSLTTLAVEFVGQAVVIGLVLGALARARGLGRVLAAVLLGGSLAALPLAVVAGLLPETVRGLGFDASVGLGNELHPFVLLQLLVPNLFGVLDAGGDLFWGGRFFSRGFPYFITLYLGPVLPALAVLGLAARPRRERWALVGLSVLGLWYALGERGGLAPLLSPFVRSLRFPVKGLLTPYLLGTLAAGLGVDRLREGRGWRLAALIAAASGLLCAVVGVVFARYGAEAAAWMGVQQAWAALVRTEVARDAWRTAAVAGAAVLVAVLAHRGHIRGSLGATLLSGLMAFDLARAGSGVDPQIVPSFFDLLPETRALELADLGGARVFTYGIDYSPAYRRYASTHPAGIALWSFFLNRQVLSPYTNVVDRIEVYGGKDLTSFVPPFTVHTAEELAPQRVADRIAEWRAASVSRVVSLDPLDHPALTRLASVPSGAAGVDIHVYALAGAWPRAYVACRVLADGEPLLDPGRDVTLASGHGTCARGTAVRTTAWPARVEYDVDVEGGEGYLVVRDRFARGWRAEVDGAPAPVLPANGRYRAVPVRPGSHHVALRYEAPGLRVGAAVSLAAVVLAAALLAARRRGSRALSPAV